jgi:hypothetical protein
VSPTGLIPNDHYRLLATTAGLEMFLAALNNTLYVLATIQTRSVPGQALLSRFLKLAGLGSPASMNAAPQANVSGSRTSPTSLQSLATLISDTRTALRLTALLSLYSSLRGLLRDKGNKDRYLRAVALVQCIAYIVFQFTENVAYLVDRGILSQKRLARTGGSAQWWLWSSRAWLAGVSCDFLKLIREAAIERQKKKVIPNQTSKEPEESLAESMDEQTMAGAWWNEMFVASCSFPLCLHYSLQDGLWGVNNGVVGLLGLMAGAQGLSAAFAKTAIS